MLPVFTFLARHFLFVVCAMVAGCVAWTLVYLALLAVATIMGQELGGALAFPAGIFVVLVSCACLGWGVFAPATAIGSICCRWFRLPRIAAIPVVWVFAFVFSYLLYGAYVASVTTHPMPPVLTVLRNFAIYLSIPVGLYWWLTEGPGALYDACRRWIRHRRSHRRVGGNGVVARG